MSETLQHALNRKAGTLINDIPQLGSVGAANVWAGTTGMGLLGALNVKAGITVPTNYLGLQAVLNQLASTSGHGIDGAAALIP